MMLPEHSPTSIGKPKQKINTPAYSVNKTDKGWINILVVEVMISICKVWGSIPTINK